MYLEMIRSKVKKDIVIFLHGTPLRLYRVIPLILVFVILLSYNLHAEEKVLFLDSPTDSAIEKQKVELTCRFYGLDIDHIVVEKNKLSKPLFASLIQGKPGAIIITAEALSNLDKKDISSLFINEMNIKTNILIMGLTDSIGNNNLNSWSFASIEGADKLSDNEEDTFFRISDDETDVARELAGQEFPFKDERMHYFLLAKGSRAQTIMGIRRNGQFFPNFIRLTLAKNEIFFLMNMSSHEFVGKVELQQYSDRFIELAPLLMFLRYSLKDYAWHSIRDYANFTIDDSWLIEPYGFLSYSGLLTEMDKADFHTTIAFIPWNFNRSKPQVVSLFQKAPERFSISIHGNDHDHREFYLYKKLPNGVWPEEALNKQEEKIKQAIARMEQFSKKESIPYDRVMIFPHTIAPEMTLDLLKKYDYWATVNTNNIPLGEDTHQDIEFFMRAVTLQFSNFPSVRRFPAYSLLSFDIARELFLDNPLLLYGHHDYFKNGIKEFNKIATMIKQIQPKVKWHSLESVAKHLYLERLREEGFYEIFSFSNNILLENVHQKGATFYIRKNELSWPPIKRLLVDNKSYPFEWQGNEILIKVFLLPGESVGIQIEHKNDLDLRTVSVAKNSLRIRALRMLSDFRDLIIARTSIGQAFINMHYKNILVIILSMFIIILFSFSIIAVLLFKKNNNES